MLSQTTHASMLVRVAKGGDRAWQEFCERYGELIYGFARRRGLQPADCDDVLQDVLATLMGAMPGFEYDPARGRFRAYLKTLTVRAVWKKTCQNRAAAPLEEVGSAAGADSDPAIDEMWEAEWRQYHLRRAMAAVAAEFNRADLAAFEQYVRQGKGAKETAEELGMSLDRVYQAKSRILRRLSEHIEVQVEQEG